MNNSLNIDANSAIKTTQMACFTGAAFLAGRKVFQGTTALTFAAGAKATEFIQNNYGPSEYLENQQAWMEQNSDRFCELTGKNVVRDLAVATALLATGFALEYANTLLGVEPMPPPLDHTVYDEQYTSSETVFDTPIGPQNFVQTFVSNTVYGEQCTSNETVFDTPIGQQNFVQTFVNNTVYDEQCTSNETVFDTPIGPQNIVQTTGESTLSGIADWIPRAVTETIIDDLTKNQQCVNVHDLYSRQAEAGEPVGMTPEQMELSFGQGSLQVGEVRTMYGDAVHALKDYAIPTLTGDTATDKSIAEWVSTVRDNIREYARTRQTDCASVGTWLSDSISGRNDRDFDYYWNRYDQNAAVVIEKASSSNIGADNLSVFLAKWTSC
jgi:hypothetical protein